MQTYELRIEDIIVEDRLRNTADHIVQDLAASMKTEGMFSPLIVRRLEGGKCKLLAGAHRLEAAKSIGWSHVTASFRDTPKWANAEWIEADDVIVETEENMRRGNLDYATGASFTVANAEARDRKKKVMDDFHVEALSVYAEELREKERQREEQAKRELAEAEARKDAEAAAKLKAELAEAEAARKKAQEAKRSADAVLGMRKHRTGGANQSGPAGQVSLSPPARRPGEHGLGLVLDEMEKEGFGKALAMRKAVLAVKAVGGVDVMREFAGTTLGTKAEVTSMMKLRKEFPEEAESLAKAAKQNRNVSARATYGQLTRDKNADDRAKKTRDAAGDQRATALLMLPYFGQIGSALVTLTNLALVGGHKDDHKELLSITARLSAVQARMSQWRAVASAKADGTEGKYKAVTKAETNARALARADQDANAKKPVAALIKKKKHTGAKAVH